MDNVKEVLFWRRGRELSVCGNDSSWMMVVGGVLLDTV